ncbi:hypothetical protein EDD17DRAFT_710842 [Pisolithus thermaeus]|nr:hypothetical protein EDD17DRAFT_710842 [Pisolithus thermaeus]
MVGRIVDSSTVSLPLRRRFASRTFDRATLEHLSPVFVGQEGWDSGTCGSGKTESTNEGLTPEQVAAGLLAGVHRGNHHIAAELIASLLHASTRGSATRSNAFVDTVLNLVGWIDMPVWRNITKSTRHT